MKSRNSLSHNMKTLSHAPTQQALQGLGTFRVTKAKKRADAGTTLDSLPFSFANKMRTLEKMSDMHSLRAFFVAGNAREKRPRVRKERVPDATPVLADSNAGKRLSGIAAKTAARRDTIKR